MDAYRAARAVLVYAHFGREARTDGIMRDAFAAGKAVCMPANDLPALTMTASRLLSAGEIVMSGWAPEPAVVRPFPPDELDLVVVPGVVFDRRGNRIGMGKGFFDRFLAGLPARAATVAPAFAFQVLDTPLPADPWDVPVHYIATERELIPCR